MENNFQRSVKLSVQDCREIVQNKLKHNNFGIVEHDLSAIEEKSGFLGDHYRLTIKINVNGKPEVLNLFAKFLPELQSQIDFVLSTGAFEKEMFIYDKLFCKMFESGYTEITSYVPPCYFTRQNHVLVFENMINSGYEMLPKYNFLDYDHLEVVIKSLAVMHAGSLIYEEKEKCNIFNKFPNNFQETFYSNREEHKGHSGMYASANAIRTEINMFYEELNAKIPKEEFIERAYANAMNMMNMVHPSKKFRNVVCHGDLWCTNILMKYKNGKPVQSVFVDFQTARYIPPAHDVMGLLYLTTKREFRLKNCEKLMELYYEELGKQMYKYGYDLNKFITHEEFLESCEEQRFFAVPQRVTYYQLTQVKGDIITEFSNDNVKWNEALYKDRSLLVLEGCQKDPEFKKILIETIKDLLDICE